MPPPNNRVKQAHSTKDAERSGTLLNECDRPTPRERGIFHRPFAVAAIVGGAVLVAGGAYVTRYELIVIPNASGPLIVEYIVKDRWTGDIEVVWQSPTQVRQSKYHPFHGSHEVNTIPSASDSKFIPLDQATEVTPKKDDVTQTSAI
jgi:hypothetical protein